MAHDPVDLEGKRILITGVTGQVAKPLAASLAKIADVFALARFKRDAERHEVEAMGVRPVKADLSDPATLSAVPDDLDYVVHCAVVKSGDFRFDYQTNAEGLGHLMARCRNVKAFLHFSTTGVYEYQGHAARKETDPLADNHRSMMPTYSTSKIAAESVCRFAAKHFGIPTTIARLNVPYGDNGGWPAMHLFQMRDGQAIIVHPERPNLYSPIHNDDILEKVPRLLAVASPDVTLVNFGGSESVGIEEWSEYLGELTGLTPKFQDMPNAFGSLHVDTTRMHELIGPTQVPWKTGLRSMVKALAPELLKA